MDFHGKSAVITGAASGIGYALAEHAAARGMPLVLADVEVEALAAAEARLSEAGARVVSVPTDVSQRGDLEALAERSYAAFGDVGLLCNNAGVSVLITRPVWELSHDDWEWVIGVNQWGLIHAVRAFLPRMMEQENPSHMLNTCSSAGLIISPGLAAYKASKHATLSISESLYHDLSAVSSRVGVSVFCPDVVKTGLRHAARNRPAHLGDALPATPEQVADEKAREAAPGLSPREAAEIAMQGVDSGRFYIFTSDWPLGAVAERVEDMGKGVPRSMRLNSDGTMGGDDQ